MACKKSAKCDCEKSRISSTKRCEPENPHRSIRILVNLMEEPMSTNLYERQIMILNDIFRASAYGYWMMDLPYVIRLIDLISHLLDDVCLFSAPFKLFLSKCSIPPLLSKTSEALEYTRDLQEYFNCLGNLIVSVKEREVQNLVIEAMCGLLNRKVPIPYCSVPLKFCEKASESSTLPFTISQLLELADEDLYENLLKVAKILSKISSLTCQKMISRQAINHLLIRLDPEWKTRNFYDLSYFNEPGSGVIQNFGLTSRILWFLLNSFKGNENLLDRKTIMPNQRALWSLRYALRILLTKQYDPAHRNYFMGIFLQCLDLFPQMILGPSGIINDILILGAATEMGTGGTWAAQIQFSSKEVDYEFKKMLIMSLYYCVGKPEVIKMLNPKRLIPALLKITTPELRNIWHAQQHNRLISLTLYTIQSVVPQLINDFIYFDGPLRLLLLVDFYNVGPYDMTILKDCLICLRSIMLTEDKILCNNIVANEGFPIFITLSTTLLSSEILTLQTQECLAQVYTVLEILFRINKCYERNVVSACFKFIDRVTKPNDNDPIFDPNFVICGIDFLWESVVWNEHNLKSFVSLGGVFKLLDIVQNSIFPIKMITLGVLVDMCEEGSCIPHLITWRGNQQKLLPMLLELFREENIRRGVKTTANGTIADIEIPIMGLQQWYATFYAPKDFDSSPATVDLLASCRPKIYAIIQLLTNRHQLRVAIANKHYCLFNTDNLEVFDQLTLLLAENFLALKLGEAWVELKHDVEQAGIRPLAVDGEVINILTRRFYSWSSHLQTVQNRLLNEKFEKQCYEEKLLYNLLKESKLVESLEALRELDYIARTTEQMFRYLSKMKQVNQINDGFELPLSHHETFLRKLKATPIFNQEVSVVSDFMMEMRDQEECDIRPLSNTCSTESNLDNNNK